LETECRMVMVADENRIEMAGKVASNGGNGAETLKMSEFGPGMAYSLEIPGGVCVNPNLYVSSRATFISLAAMATRVPLLYMATGSSNTGVIRAGGKWSCQGQSADFV